VATGDGIVIDLVVATPGDVDVGAGWVERHPRVEERRLPGLVVGEGLHHRVVAQAHDLQRLVALIGPPLSLTAVHDHCQRGIR